LHPLHQHKDPQLQPDYGARGEAGYIGKLRTSSVSLEPLYKYREGRQFLMGYRASNSLAFRVDVAQAGMVIDAIVELGVSRIDGVSFIASPQYLNAARHVAIAAAEGERAASRLFFFELFLFFSSLPPNAPNTSIKSCQSNQLWLYCIGEAKRAKRETKGQGQRARAKEAQRARVCLRRQIVESEEVADERV